MKRNISGRIKFDKLSFWQSYSDMMAALLMVFMLILFASLFSYEKKQEELSQYEYRQRELEKDKKALEKDKKILQNRVEEIVGVRKELIEALKNEFSDSGLSVKVDPQTGAIKFDSNLLFGYNKSVLQKRGTDFLDEFIPKYLAVVMSDEFDSMVAEIIIEGHTDSAGSYMYNLRLSQNRAFAVASYCLNNKKNLLTNSQLARLRELMTANGRSWSNLIYYENGKENAKASRRVEIKFRLREEKMMNELRSVLE